MVVGRGTAEVASLRRQQRLPLMLDRTSSQWLQDPFAAQSCTALGGRSKKNVKQPADTNEGGGREHASDTR